MIVGIVLSKDCPLDKQKTSSILTTGDDQTSSKVRSEVNVQHIHDHGHQSLVLLTAEEFQRLEHIATCAEQYIAASKRVEREEANGGFASDASLEKEEAAKEKLQKAVGM